MYNFIVKLKNGEKYHLKTDYKRIFKINKMALYYYIESFSQVSRQEIDDIRKPISSDELDECSLIINIDKSMIKRFNKFLERV